MSVETIQRRAPLAQQAGYGRALTQRLTQFVCYVTTCLNVARQRRHLRALDDRMLKDIGISAFDAQQEASRSFWDVPEDLRSDR